MALIIKTGGIIMTNFLLGNKNKVKIIHILSIVELNKLYSQLYIKVGVKIAHMTELQK